MQHEAADKSIEFFKTIRYYRNACEAYLKDESSRGHANATILQDKTQGDEAQKSKNQKNNPSNKRDNPGDNRSKKEARKCVCDEIHEFDECSYIVSSTRTSD
jgi:hypothetical protein